MIPDEKIGWIPHTLIKARQIMRQENISVFCTTSPPHSSHLIGLLLKKAVTNSTWIADFRDPWTQSFMKRPMHDRHKIRYKLERIMDKMVLEASNRVITVTEGQKSMLIKTYGHIFGTKIKVITNGFDEADFENIDGIHGKEENSKFLITHIGIVYPGMSHAFLKSFKELIDENEEFRLNVIVRFIGFPEKDNLVSMIDLEEYIQFEGFHEHDQVIKDMLSSDLLLLMVGKEKFWVPGKLFEYIRAKIPILVIGAQGDATNIALKSGLGLVASHENTLEIKRQLLEVFQRKIHGLKIVKPDEAYINGFARKNLTKKFVELLNKTIQDY